MRGTRLSISATCRMRLMRLRWRLRRISRTGLLRRDVRRDGGELRDPERFPGLPLPTCVPRWARVDCYQCRYPVVREPDPARWWSSLQLHADVLRRVAGGSEPDLRIGQLDRRTGTTPFTRTSCTKDPSLAAQSSNDVSTGSTVINGCTNYFSTTTWTITPVTMGSSDAVQQHRKRKFGRWHAAGALRQRPRFVDRTRHRLRLEPRFNGLTPLKATAASTSKLNRELSPQLIRQALCGTASGQILTAGGGPEAYDCQPSRGLYLRPAARLRRPRPSSPGLSDNNPAEASTARTSMGIQDYQGCTRPEADP